MPSSLTWLDHDPAARDRSLRILALFREKESRDELGIGGIRDAISDRLFPGTSTIQRLSGLEMSAIGRQHAPEALRCEQLLDAADLASASRPCG